MWFLNIDGSDFNGNSNCILSGEEHAN
jgi:hypothetical protein